MVGIINYGLGNLYSVAGALTRLEVPFQVSSRPEDLRKADHLILPGVGAFTDGMKNIRSLGLDTLLREQVLQKKVPILGICLGFQLLFSRGYEFEETEGLGLLDGDVPKLDKEALGLRVPHVGWNEIRRVSPSPLFHDVAETDCFYFVHSYRARPANPDFVSSYCDYGEPFPASVQRENVFGTQFHPEKSQRAGLKVLENFVRWSSHA